MTSPLKMFAVGEKTAVDELLEMCDAGTMAMWKSDLVEKCLMDDQWKALVTSDH